MQAITRTELQCIHDTLSQVVAEGYNVDTDDAMEIVTSLLNKYDEEEEKSVEDWLEENDRILNGGC